MKSIAFFISFIAIWSAIWTSLRTLCRNQAHKVGFAGTSGVIFLIMYALKCQKTVTLLFICFTLLIYQVHERWRNPISAWLLRHRFSIEVVLEEIILQMRTGRGLRRSLREMQRSPRWQDTVSQTFLQTAVKALSDGPSGDQLKTCRHGREWIRELVRIDRTHHQALVALKAWRDRLRMERGFSARARQVTLQVRLQAGLGVLIYVGALLMGWSSGDLWRLGWLLPLSGVLLAGGVLMILQVGRSIRWNF